MVLNMLLASTAAKSSVGVLSSTVLVFPLLLTALSYYRYDELDPESKIIDQNTFFPTYDFIVVGGGSAGAVVANRLSEVANWKVLLIEAGPDENEISDVPSLSAYLQLSKLDWSYKTEPSNRSCLGMKENRCNWPRGKVLGGSSGEFLCNQLQLCIPFAFSDFKTRFTFNMNHYNQLLLDFDLERLVFHKQRTRL